MTLEEAIQHCEEVAEKNEKKASWFWGKEGNSNYEKCVECASDHRQLAEWLRELKKYRALFEKVGEIFAENGYTMDDLDTIFGKANDEEVNADV